MFLSRVFVRCAQFSTSAAHIAKQLRGSGQPVSVTAVTNCIEDAYHSRDQKAALHIYDLAMANHIQPDLRLMKAALWACTLTSDGKKFKKARKILGRMRELKVGPDLESYELIILLSGKTKDWGKSKYFFSQIRAQSFEITPSVEDSLLMAAADAGEANSVWSLLRRRSTSSHLESLLLSALPESSDKFCDSITLCASKSPFDRHACLAGLKAAASTKSKNLSEIFLVMHEILSLQNRRECGEKQVKAARDAAWSIAFDSMSDCSVASNALLSRMLELGYKPQIRVFDSVIQSHQSDKIIGENIDSTNNDHPDAETKHSKHDIVVEKIEVFDNVEKIEGFNNLFVREMQKEKKRTEITNKLWNSLNHIVNTDTKQKKTQLYSPIKFHKNIEKVSRNLDKDGVESIKKKLNLVQNIHSSIKLSTLNSAAASLLCFGPFGLAFAFLKRAQRLQLLPKANVPVMRFKRRHKKWIQSDLYFQQFTPEIYDFHGYSPAFVEVVIRDWFDKLNDLVIIVGRGVHSVDKLHSRMRPFVSELLHSRLFSEPVKHEIPMRPNDGFILIRKDDVRKAIEANLKCKRIIYSDNV